MKKIIYFLAVLPVLFGCEPQQGQNKSLTDELIGEWKLVSFVNEADGTSIDASNPEYYFNDSEVQIIIHFKENYRYDGTTGANTFGGKYSINNSGTVIIFYDEYTTEAGDNAFGSLFYDNLRLNYNHQTQNTESGFELNGNIFKLYYSENEYMKFVRLE